MISLEVLHSTDELRQLILDHPDLPLLISAGEEAAGFLCTSISVRVGEFLDCDQNIDEEITFTDREYFEEEVRDKYEDFDGTEEEWEAFIERKLAEYEPYWKRCIILHADI